MLSLTERPKLLSEMVGQKHILNLMKEYGRDKDYPNFMLFYGDSGSGKSTLAFIVSKTINCENPITNSENYYEPCNKCTSCNDINASKFSRDVHYMDASKMGKSEVEKLSTIVSRMPMYDNKRVIIIDEAHLLNSKEARGAMLLLLEKPIKSVIFILCTTDISKFDNAFLNRLQQFKFKPLSTNSIGDYLGSLFNKQIIEWSENGKDLGDNGIEFKGKTITQSDIENFAKEVIPLISFNSKGALRQALQYYEQCIKLLLFNRKEVINAMGFFDDHKAEEIMINILNIKNIDNVYKYLQEIDVRFFYNYLYKICQESLIYQNTKYIFDTRKEYLYKSFAFHSNLKSLFDVILDIETNRIGYSIADRLIISKIVNFMLTSTPEGVTLTEPNKPPVRRVKHRDTID